jgi:hypothetical protein
MNEINEDYQMSNVFIRQNTTTLNVIIHVNCVSLFVAIAVGYNLTFNYAEHRNTDNLLK